MCRLETLAFDWLLEQNTFVEPRFTELQALKERVRSEGGVGGREGEREGEHCPPRMARRAGTPSLIFQLGSVQGRGV